MGAAASPPSRAHRGAGRELLGTLRRRSYLLVTVACVVAFFLVWNWLTSSGVLHRIVVPPPGRVIERSREILGEPYFRRHLWVTVKEVVLGYTIGAGSGIVMALVSARFTSFRHLLQPYIVALQSLPKVILLPMIAIWVGGYGETSAMIIVVLVSFFPVYINSLTGLLSADENGLKLLHSLGATPRQAFRMFRIPAALPLLFTGLKTAVNFSVVAAITAELLGARYGLGFMLANSGTFLRIEDLYATVVVVSLFAGLVYAIFELADRKFIFWREDRNRFRSEERER